MSVFGERAGSGPLGSASKPASSSSALPRSSTASRVQQSGRAERVSAPRRLDTALAGRGSSSSAVGGEESLQVHEQLQQFQQQVARHQRIGHSGPVLPDPHSHAHRQQQQQQPHHLQQHKKGRSCELMPLTGEFGSSEFQRMLQTQRSAASGMGGSDVDDSQHRSPRPASTVASGAVPPAGIGSLGRLLGQGGSGGSELLDVSRQGSGNTSALNSSGGSGHIAREGSGGMVGAGVSRHSSGVIRHGSGGHASGGVPRQASSSAMWQDVASLMRQGSEAFGWHSTALLRQRSSVQDEGSGDWRGAVTGNVGRQGGGGVSVGGGRDGGGRVSDVLHGAAGSEEESDERLLLVFEVDDTGEWRVLHGVCCFAPSTLWLYPADKEFV